MPNGLIAAVAIGSDARIDLATEEGVRAVKGQWRYSDTRVIETQFLAPGSDGQPGDKPNGDPERNRECTYRRNCSRNEPAIGGCV